MGLAYLALLILFGITACVDAQAAYDEPVHEQGTMPNWWCHPRCGGRKIEENIVWQSAFDIKLKHTWDHTRNGCFLTCNITNSTLPPRIFNIRYD